MRSQRHRYKGQEKQRQLLKKKQTFSVDLFVGQEKNPAYLLCSLFTLKQNDTDISYQANTTCVFMVEEDLAGCLKCAEQILQALTKTLGRLDTISFAMDYPHIMLGGAALLYAELLREEWKWLRSVSVSSWCRESISAENSYTGEDRLGILKHTMSDVFSIS
ncbi:hypothetical protein CapIbe_017626 [Capra ibex]